MRRQASKVGMSTPHEEEGPSVPLFPSRSSTTARSGAARGQRTPVISRCAAGFQWYYRQAEIIALLRPKSVRRSASCCASRQLVRADRGRRRRAAAGGGFRFGRPASGLRGRSGRHRKCGAGRGWCRWMRSSGQSFVLVQHGGNPEVCITAESTFEAGAVRAG